MQRPAYVLYIERDTEEHLVELYQSLDEAEDALRDYAATIFIAPRDGDIVEVLAESGIRPRIFACTLVRGKQRSIELMPFATKERVAAHQ
jgi:hypothetical protein